MSLLLDTNAALAVVEDRLEALPRSMREMLLTEPLAKAVSIASLWEIEIKHRIGKLPLATALPEWPAALASVAIRIVPITLDHVLAEIVMEPTTKDPFDRLLLGVCAAEGLKLVTIDRQLATHPLAWRPT